KKSRKLWRMALLFMVFLWCRAWTSDNKALYPLKFRPYRRQRTEYERRRRDRGDAQLDREGGDRAQPVPVRQGGLCEEPGALRGEPRVAPRRPAGGPRPRAGL